ncbi:MAG: hypothetical protein ACRDG3_13795, partial [Tepidiformaceae bacterium]
MLARLQRPVIVALLTRGVSSFQGEQMKLIAILLAAVLVTSACGGLTHSSGPDVPPPTYPPGFPTPRGMGGLQEPTNPNAPPAPTITVNSPVSGGDTLVVAVKATQLAVCTVAYGTVNT